MQKKHCKNQVVRNNTAVESMEQVAQYKLHGRIKFTPLVLF